MTSPGAVVNPRANKPNPVRRQIPDTQAGKFKLARPLGHWYPLAAFSKPESDEPASSAAAVALAGKFRVTGKVGCGREAPSYGASMLAPLPMPVFRKRGNKQEKKVRAAGRREPATVAGLPLTARLRVPLS